MPLTPAGLELPTVEELLVDIETDQATELGEEIERGPTSLLGSLNAVVGNQLRVLTEGIDAVYASFDPDSATGAALDRLCALTGTVRIAATFSVALVDVTVGAGFSYSVGDVILSVSGAPERRFANSVAFSNPGGVPVVVPGVEFTAEDSGPVEAVAGTLTVLAEPVAGIISATNPLDADLGRVAETDDELRVRRRTDLARGGSATPDAIRVDVEDVMVAAQATGYRVRVYENTTDLTDVDGLPPHSFETLAYDGTVGGTAVPDADIALAIWESKPAGIATFGMIATMIVDSIGETHTVNWSRPTAILVVVEVDIEAGVEYTAAVETTIKEAIVAFGDLNFSLGDDVRTSLITCAVIDAVSLPSEIVDVVEVRLGIDGGPAPVAANLAIGIREVADLDTSRITVTTI